MTLRILVAALAFFSVGCQLTLKVDKKPRSVTASDTKGATADRVETSSLLQDPEFLATLDSLKGVVIDRLLKEYAEGDYRKAFREGVRHYRQKLIDRALAPVEFADDFYDGDVECRKTKLSLNLDEADEILGTIMQAAVLAGMSEAAAKALDISAAPSELQAIVKLVQNDLGIEVDGPIDVEKVGSVTIVRGNVTFKLLPLDIEGEDEAVKKRDEVEVIEMNFERSTDDNLTGFFTGKLGIGYLDEAEIEKAVAFNVDVTREKSQEGLWLHTSSLELGVAGNDPHYARSLSFAQMDEKMFQVTDVIGGGDEEQVFVSTFDLDEAEQCKLSDIIEDKGVESDGDGTDGLDDSKSNGDPVEPPPVDDGPQDTPDVVVQTPGDDDGKGGGPSQQGPSQQSPSQK